MRPRRGGSSTASTRTGELREEFYTRRAAHETVDQRLEEARGRLVSRQQAIARGDQESARLAALIDTHAADLARIDAEMDGRASMLAGAEARAHETTVALASGTGAAAEVKGALEEAAGRLREEAHVETESQRALARAETRTEAVVSELTRVAGDLEAIDAEDGALAVREADLAEALAGRRHELGRTTDEEAVAAAALARAREEAAAVDSAPAAAREEHNAATARPWQTVDEAQLKTYLPDWDEQAKAVSAITGSDGFNWGYDPLHYTTPEGSYATDPNGTAHYRIS